MFGSEHRASCILSTHSTMRSTTTRVGWYFDVFFLVISTVEELHTVYNGVIIVE